MNDIAPTDRPIHGPINDAGDGQVVTEQSAKQGRRGRHMLVVLGISTSLAIAALFGIWSLSFTSLGARAPTPVSSTSSRPLDHPAQSKPPLAAHGSPN